jgi:hypothetical protein
MRTPFRTSRLVGAAILTLAARPCSADASWQLCSSPDRLVPDLPAPVRMTLLSVPNSGTPRREHIPRPRLSAVLLGLPIVRTSSTLLFRYFRGSIARPAPSPPYASPCRSPAMSQGVASRGWAPPGVGLASILWCQFIMLTYCLPPVCAGAASPARLRRSTSPAFAALSRGEVRWPLRGRARTECRFQTWAQRGSPIEGPLRRSV